VEYCSVIVQYRKNAYCLVPSYVAFLLLTWHILCRLPSKAALYTHMKNCHGEEALDMEEDEDFGDELGREEGCARYLRLLSLSGSFLPTEEWEFERRPDLNRYCLVELCVILLFN
jgi:hypothetical protein